LLGQIQEFKQKLDRVSKYAIALRLIHGMPEACEQLRRSLGKSNCSGCCILETIVQREQAGRFVYKFPFGFLTGERVFKAPEGAPIKIVSATLFFVDKDCSKATPPSRIYDYALDRRIDKIQMN